MEQLFATFGINWKILLIQVVNFGILLAILSKFLYRPIMKIIDERQAKIADGVRTAEAATRRLDEAKSEGDKMVGEAAREAEGLVASARVRAEEKGNELLKDAQRRADKVMEEASARAGEAQRQAMLASERDIARAAMLAAEKILREKTA